MVKKFYKVKIFKDNRLTITLHSFYPNKTNKPLPTSRPDKINLKPINDYMSTKEYKRLLKSDYKRLWDRDFSQGYYFFITLTLKNDLTYNKFIKELHRFWVYVKRKFGKFEYVRAIELQEKTLRLHVHYVLQFQDKPTYINKEVITNLWGLGICDFQPVDDIWAPLQYITHFKPHHIQKDNPYFSYFPKGAKVISTSLHFGSVCSSDFYREELISADHLKFILDYHFNEFKKGVGKFVRVDEHRYYDIVKCESACCMDKVYIRTSKEFIENNFDFLNDENKPP